MEQRARSESTKLNVHDLAADIWDAAGLIDSVPVTQWVTKNSQADVSMEVPEERPAALVDNPLFPDHTVYFGRARRKRVNCEYRSQARLVLFLAELGITGTITMPGGPESASNLLERLEVHLTEARAAFLNLVESRTEDPRMRAQLMDLLQLWFVRGRDEDGGLSAANRRGA